MYKLILKAFLITSLIILSNCGFKVLDNAGSNDFNIKEIEVNGDNNRINFKIKNGILNNSREDSVNDIILKISIKKNKNIKEKNIKNEITKYKINLNTNGNNYFIKKNRKSDFSLSVVGSYSVNTKNYSNTINNEKNLINNLTEKLAKNILKEINKTVNDF